MQKHLRPSGSQILAPLLCQRTWFCFVPKRAREGRLATIPKSSGDHFPDPEGFSHSALLFPFPDMEIFLVSKGASVDWLPPPPKYLCAL